MSVRARVLVEAAIGVLIGVHEFAHEGKNRARHIASVYTLLSFL